MRTFKITILILVLLPNLLYSVEPNINWEKTYNHQVGGVYSFDVLNVQIVNNKFLIGYSSSLRNNPPEFGVGYMYFNQSGDIIKEIFIQDSSDFFNISFSQKGYTLRALCDVTFYKGSKIFTYDLVGNEISKPYFNNSEGGWYFWSLYHLTDDYIYCPRSVVTGDTLFTNKYDYTLNIQGEIQVNLNTRQNKDVWGGMISNSIYFEETGFIAILYGPTKKEPKYGVMIWYDEEGNIIKDTKLESDLLDMFAVLGAERMQDGSIILSCQEIVNSQYNMKKLLLIKIDEDGNKIWEKLHNFDEVLSIRKVIPFHDGKYYAAYANYYPTGIATKRDFWLSIFDSEGNLIGKYTWDRSEVDELQGAIEGENGNLVLVGRTNDFDNLYLAEVDMTNTDINEVTSANNKSLIYPNPVSEFISIAQENIHKYQSYEISDLMGRAVQSGTLESDKIMLEDFPAGIYFLKLISTTETKSMKFVVGD